ncbi:hypothetical protein G6F22_020994 [Rhizopus arrhizus]|nr:hypothetical protein G6F22_020994 [Rhizopus arrhizus]KAG1247946.1 hypothetical protein G6F65_019891 [Rhizopus arrhizus]
MVGVHGHFDPPPLGPVQDRPNHPVNQLELTQGPLGEHCPGHAALLVSLDDPGAGNDVIPIQRGPGDTVGRRKLLRMLGADHRHRERLGLLQLHGLDVRRGHPDYLHRSSLVPTTGISATRVTGSGCSFVYQI